MSTDSKRTPNDATDFEREQLRFLLGKTNVAAVLAELNPSLAWLPILSELKLIDAQTQLAPWIEKNFADREAIKQVAANIHYFSPDTADLLEFRLNQAPELPSLLLKSWRLIMRHMRSTKRGMLRDEWFDIAPRIKQGDSSAEVLERLADVLRPKVRAGRRLSLYGNNGEVREPGVPTDLMSIDFEIQEHVTDQEVLSAWPQNAPSQADERLLRLLSSTVTAAVEDAVEAGVESNEGYGLSDSDVPSVATHSQNAHRTGFFAIVRVAAELWNRLARKDLDKALPFVELWRTSAFRLVRRLATFAAADVLVPPRMAAEVLLTIPRGELFLTSSSVEAYRLLDSRWGNLSTEDRRAIEERIIEGPPSEWFRESREELVDRCRFDVLGHLAREGAHLSAEALSVLDDIRRRWPRWGLRPKERAGFHSWHESSSGVVGDPATLATFSDAELVPAAKRLADKNDFKTGDAWQALCQSDPARALRGLEAEAAIGSWPEWAWRPLLWAAPKSLGGEHLVRIARLLVKWPEASFPAASAASWWLAESAKHLEDDLSWNLWDRIADASLAVADESAVRDVLSASLNHPLGHLTEFLLKRVASIEAAGEPPEPVRVRLERLLGAPGKIGLLVRVRLAGEVAFLFDRIPGWTEKHVVPLFDWSSADAGAAWGARKYARHIGSPGLYALTKQPFLQLFQRSEVSDDDIRTFADWLALIRITNQSEEADYPISAAEARTALRHAGTQGLSSVGHRLAIEMESAKPDEKVMKWRQVIGPVFQSIWPLDIDLQTPASTFKLVQILRSSGSAFAEAADVITPFIQPEDARQHTSVFSISRADELLYSEAPERMLDLLVAVVGDTPAWHTGLETALDRIRKYSPQLANTKRFQRLLGLAGETTA